jgi:tricorn protease-like protein
MTVKNIWLSFFVLLSVTLNSQVTELWNVSPSGGLNQHGLIYKVNGDGSGFEELVSMDSLNTDNLCSELTLSQGYVYGFAYQGASAFLYRVNTTTRSYEKVINLPTSISSSRHFSKLTGVNGRYYFISASGGSNGYGGVYAYDTAAQSILSLTDFSTQTGFYPIDVNQPLSGRINGLVFCR